MFGSSTISVPTAQRVDIIDITPLIEGYVSSLGLQAGIVHVVVKHTSAAIAVQEHEPNLVEDFRSFLTDWLKDDPENPNFKHNQMWRRPDVPSHEPQNADAHLKALLVGNSRVVAVKDGKLDLGAWQRVLLIEMDGPRDREVQIMAQGEPDGASLLEYWSECSLLIDAAIEPYLKRDFVGDALSTGMYIMRGGKRIRGTLTLLVCEALGGNVDRAMDAAVAVEMVHSASIVKDDLQDGDKKRRGHISAWFAYSIRRATSMVDVVVPHAFSMLKKYGKEAVYAGIEAWKEVGIGQAKDLFVGSFKSRDVYAEINKSKTGALFALSCTLGAIAAGANREQKHLALQYGLSLGTAFQVMDDLADLEEGKAPPQGLEEWVKGDAKAKVEQSIAKTQKIAADFPSSKYRVYLVELPRLAYGLMLEEARKNKQEKKRGHAGASRQRAAKNRAV